MNNYGVVPAMCLALFSWAFACPVFTEFYPDPKDVSDQEGEYVEIRMDDFRAESLYVQFESKSVMAFVWPEAERFVLVHDSAQCLAREGCCVWLAWENLAAEFARVRLETLGGLVYGFCDGDATKAWESHSASGADG